LKILKNCRRAIHPNGRLLVVDAVLTRSAAPTALMDMLMMVLTSGRKRTEPEFRSLLQEAGFSLLQVIRAAGARIMETRAVSRYASRTSNNASQYCRDCRANPHRISKMPNAPSRRSGKLSA
jgi:hypothetical protein